jgi:hypothetical protein
MKGLAADGLWATALGDLRLEGAANRRFLRAPDPCDRSKTPKRAFRVRK